MELFGAIDVGSNSVRLQIAAFVSGFQHHVVHEDRMVTRLGESVFETGELSERAMKQTITVLKNFRGQAEAHSVVALRAVGTSALRDAQNGKRFLATVRRECGIDIDIISGREEARLIHLGVVSRLPAPPEQIFILDVGGGSAEFILGTGTGIGACHSAPLGAVRLTELFLESDPPAPAEIERMESYVRKKLGRAKDVLANNRARGANPAITPDGERTTAIGSSGTMAALTRAINQVPLPRPELEGLSFRAAQAEAYYKRVRVMSLAERRESPGLGTRRAEIIVAGAAVVALAMQQLELRSLTYSEAGLRDGVLVELAARHRGDAAGVQFLNAERLQSVQALAQHFNSAEEHTAHVAMLARQLFQALEPVHQLPAAYGELLEAAALLHNVGKYVSGAKMHKHSFYLIANSELPGYSDSERRLIAIIARYQRGALPTPSHEGFSKLTSAQQAVVMKLSAILRLADALDSGGQRTVQSVLANAKSDRVELTLLAGGPAELETWAAKKAVPLFRRAYHRRLEIEVRTMKPVLAS